MPLRKINETIPISLFEFLQDLVLDMKNENLCSGSHCTGDSTLLLNANSQKLKELEDKTEFIEQTNNIDINQEDIEFLIHGKFYFCTQFSI